MPSDVKTPGLVINTLTQEQFDDLINPSDTELFLTPDTTAEDIENAVSTHNTDTTAHNDIRQAISNKSTVSVSATGTATDEVQYITVDGVEKKLAGGSGGVEYTAGQGININPTTHVITNTDHQYMPYNVSTSNKLTTISDVSTMAYEYGSYFKGNYDTWTDVPTDQWEYRKNMGRDSTPTENDIIFVKDISNYEDIIAINPPLENGGLDLAYGYETESTTCVRTHNMYRLNSSATYTIRIKKEDYTGTGTLSARLFYYKTDINHQYTNFVSEILPVVFNENDYCDVKLKPDDYCSRLVIHTNGDDITSEDFSVEFIEDVDTTYPQIGAVFGYYGTWEENGKDGWKINYTLNTSSSGATSLEDLTDVNINTPTNNQALIYDAENEEWVNGTVIATGVKSEDVEYINGDFTTVKEALDSLLYRDFTISLSGGRAYESGETVTNPTLTWSYILGTKPITSQTLKMGSTTITTSLSDRSYTYSGTISTNTTFTLTTSDGKTTKNAQTSFIFQPRRYWGVSDKTSLTDAEILALSSELSTSRIQSRTFNCSGGKYFYFVIRTNYCTNIAFKVGGLSFSDMHVETRNVVNAQGYSASYNIYRCNNLMTGSSILVEVS